MTENVRFAIEKEEKLQEEVLLKDKDFIVDLVEAVSFHFWTVMDSNLNNILTCYVRFALLTMGRVYTKYHNFFFTYQWNVCVCFIFCLFLLRGFYNIILLAFSANPHSFIIAVNVLSTKKTLVKIFLWVAIFTCGRAFHSYYPEGKWGTTRSVWTSTFSCAWYIREFMF